MVKKLKESTVKLITEDVLSELNISTKITADEKYITPTGKIEITKGLAIAIWMISAMLLMI